MDINKSLIILLVASLAYFVLYYLVLKSDRFVSNQSVKHTCLLLYIIMAFFVGVYIFENGDIVIDAQITSVSLMIIMLMVGINIIMVKFFTDKVIDITTTKQKIITLFLELMIFFFLFSFLHYVEYWFRPGSFAIEHVSKGWFDIAISFLYYSFSTSITFSASGIEPVSSLAKILSMVHISFFYLIIGESLFSELKGRKL